MNTAARRRFGGDHDDGNLGDRTISVSIGRDVREVYDFVANPANLSRWASGLGESIRQEDGQWLAQTAAGPARIEFVARNPLGVLDHTVVLPAGTRVFVPMRVIPNGSGCELLLTLFRLPETPESQFEDDARWVRKDLTALKQLLEAEISAVDFA